jgi:protease-4
MLKRFFISMLGSLTAIWISFMLLAVLCMTMLISSIAGAFSGTTSVTVEKNSILCLNLDSEIVEYAGNANIYSFLNDQKHTVSLVDIINALDAAADDDNITALYVKCDGASAGVATRKAIRDAVLRFKDSGKKVIAYAGAYSQGDYYIASAADEVLVNPIGSVELKGLSSGIPFFKNLLDKAGVEMQIVKVGTFKSAVEPYILTGMSEANRLQTTAYLDSLWTRMATEIASSRGIPVSQVNMLADSLLSLTQASELEKLKIVDGYVYTDELISRLKKLSKVTKKGDSPKLISISDYLASGVTLPNSKSAEKKIAIYYASGDITESGKDGIASDRVVPDILDIADDDDIDALVLRVNSGGGSAYASEQIWHALEVLKSKGKPFYVSMGDVAASGGYYISCGADKIFAEPVTLTGSIGIFGMIPCVKQLLTDKVGVNFDFVSTNANSVGINLFEPMTPFVRARLQNEINHGYDLFTSRCAKGRHVSQDSIKAIAEGRVWSGGAAKKIGLVDELGSLNDAVKALAKNNKYKKYQVVSYPDADRSIFDILLDLNSQMKVKALKEDMGVYYPVYEHLQTLKDMAPVQARMEQVVVQ